MSLEQPRQAAPATPPRPLEGIKVVEVAMWAFVPVAGGILSDMGANVIKVEPPTGDPLRGLKIGGGESAGHGFVISWENYNRGKRSITLDLRKEESVEVLHRLLEDADVFLTNLLPEARQRMKIDAASLRPRFPKLIYAVGSALGPRGPESNKGGYDSITFWARGGIASQVTPDDWPHPMSQPGPAFGDTASGAMLAGAIAAAIAQRAMTGYVAEVDVSLLNASMWLMQRSITEATLENKLTMPKADRNKVWNPLVFSYATADNRFVALNMMEGRRAWPGLCEAIGRPDLLDDARFSAENWNKHSGDCVRELAAVFAARPLAEWREILAKQDGAWDVVQHVGELKDDRQVNANEYLQAVDYGDGRAMKMVSVPMQFDRAPLRARPAPGLGADSDAILSELGYGEDDIINLKIAGAVF